MVKQKQRINALGTYVAPECEALEFRFEGALLIASPGAWDSSILLGTDWGGDGTGYGLE